MKSTTTMTRLLVSLGAAALLLAAGCDSSSDDTNPATDAGPTDTTATDNGGSADNGTATDNGGTADTEADTGGGAAGACMNAADLAIDQDETSTKAKDCGLGCLNDADTNACAQACVVEQTGHSEACSQCYTDTILCSINNCIPACLTPDSEACQTCQAENCTPAFFACTGFESDCGNGVDDNGDGNTDCDDESCAGDTACAQ